jgi:hypothetical protein
MHVCPRDGVYWNRKTIAYTDEDWRRLIRHLRQDIGIEMLFLQNVAKDEIALYPSNVMSEQLPTGCEDPVGAIYRACSEENVQMFAGIGFMKGAFETAGFTGEFAKRVEWHQRVSVEVHKRYGQEPSFAGFYASSEMAVRDGAFDAEQVRFMREMTECWRTLAPDKPILASPYVVGDVNRNGALVQSIIDTGVDILAYQDGVGFSTRYKPIDPRRNSTHFADLRWAHDQTPVKLWANTELFRFENDIHFQPLLPGPFSRIKQQIECAAPHVERIVAYTVPGIMTSQEKCPDLGVPETERLYQAYLGYSDTIR